MTQTHKIGIDLGKSSIKYVTGEIQGDIPSWLARGRIAQVVGNGNGTGNIRYKGQDYVVGKDAVLGHGFSWSATEDKDEQRNLLFCLTVLGNLGIARATVVIGLPVSQAANPAIVNRVKNMLSGRHEIVTCGRESVIETSVSVLSEPLGTYFSLVLSPDGRMINSSPYMGELVGIVDIGYRTLDVVALDGGRLATTQDSTLSGVAVLYDQVAKLIEADHGKLRPNEVAKLNIWLIGGCQDQLTIAGRHVRQDLPAAVARYKTELAGRIMDEVSSLLSAVRPDKLVVTGGGARLLGPDILRINPQLAIHPQARMANAIGFYRAAKAMGDPIVTGGANAENRNRIAPAQSR